MELRLKRKLRSAIWEGEVCKICDRDQRLAWYVEDDLWEEIVPARFKAWVMCLECFLKFADNKGVIISLDDIKMAGIA